jgi:hypothetical protein
MVSAGLIANRENALARGEKAVSSIDSSTSNTRLHTHRREILKIE